nr:D-aminoacid aminotransferase-like PLP-dependent enzymes superfamily protein [Tanacetum cinerariifolium]
MTASLQKITYLNWESLIESFVNDSMTKAMPYALKERKSETELVFTALVSGNLRKLVPYDKAGEKDKNGAHLAVVGHGRDVANAKYSDWVSRMRKPLEKLRPPSATELLLSNDGDHILEGCLTNFFVLCRKTAPIGGGVLPIVVREVVIKVWLEIGIPVREVAPSWSKLKTLFMGRSIYYKWLEAFAACGYNLSSCFMELTEF